MQDQLVAWQALCEQAANEKDPERLMKLIREIIQLLDERRNRQSPESVA